LPFGDKTLQNPRLDRRFLEMMNFKISRAFAEDTAPEDGTVSPGEISCTHSVMLKSGKKNKELSLVGEDEVDFIKAHGKKEGDSWRLPVGKLKKLLKSSSSNDAQTALRLYTAIQNNPSNQIKDEKLIIEKLGIRLNDTPVSVFHHEKSKNVTVSWRWTTAGEIYAMRFAIIAPPNDVKKRRILRKWLLENRETTEKMHRQLSSRDVEVNRWWIDELE
jgi:hypothetical protein